MFSYKRKSSRPIYCSWRKQKRDHRVLGPLLDLFVINEDIGKGLPLLTPKDNYSYAILEYERKLEREMEFTEVWTPSIAKSDIYKRTGHWDHYCDVMCAPFGIDNETYVLKPMNCPHHYKMIYASRPEAIGTCRCGFQSPGHVTGMKKWRTRRAYASTTDH